jgi:PPOX class probable F420-dependent enzyme
MRLDPAEARARFAAAPVLRLATADQHGRPHLVPCTFVVDDAERIAIGIDNKPKTSAHLRRIRNIAENPRVSLLADQYSGDWTRLWWARADGTAIIEHGGIEHGGIEHGGAEHDVHWRQLVAKYPQYHGQVLGGPVILVTVDSWSGWAFSDESPSS